MEPEALLRAVLEQQTSLLSFTYRASWWAGQSTAPGNGSRTVRLHRQDSHFEGEAEISFRAADLRDITCRCTLRFAADVLDRPIADKGLGTSSSDLCGDVELADCGGRESLDLTFDGGRKLAFVRGGPRSNFWGLVGEDQHRYEYTERTGLRSEVLDRLIEELEKRLAFDEQQSRLIEALQNWDVRRYD